MSNSPLVNYTKISPKSNPRKNLIYNPSGKITKITPHIIAGNMTVEAAGEWFINNDRSASANYSIGSDGRIGLHVEENRRAWTSSSRANDYLAVTIEVANDGGAPNWHVSDKALESLVKLCVDICKRNGIEKLNFTGNKNGNLTMHKYFAATACPGPYLESKFPYIEQEVNRRLGLETPEPEQTVPENTTEEPKKLTVDGKWGKATTTRLQQIFGTTVDGIVSNQYACYKAKNPGLGSGWEWETAPKPTGSPLIKAMQKWAGIPASKQDGFIGPDTIKAFQNKLGTYPDGKVSKVSSMVMALQRWANNQ